MCLAMFHKYAMTTDNVYTEFTEEKLQTIGETKI
jgi:hypothetical protein